MFIWKFFSQFVGNRQQATQMKYSEPESFWQCWSHTCVMLTSIQHNSTADFELTVNITY